MSFPEMLSTVKKRDPRTASMARVCKTQNDRTTIRFPGMDLKFLLAYNGSKDLWIHSGSHTAHPNKWISESRVCAWQKLDCQMPWVIAEAIPVPKLKCCVHFLKRPLGLVSAWSGSCLEVRTNAAVKKHADCRLSTCWSQTLPNLSCTSRHIKCWWICWARVQDEQVASFLGRCSLAMVNHSSFGAQRNHLCAPTCSNVTRSRGNQFTRGPCPNLNVWSVCSHANGLYHMWLLGFQSSNRTCQWLVSCSSGMMASEIHEPESARGWKLRCTTMCTTILHMGQHYHHPKIISLAPFPGLLRSWKKSPRFLWWMENACWATLG